VTPCIPRCDPVQCDVTDFNGNSQRLASFGRKKREAELQPKDGENIMVASVIHISDKFQLGDKSMKKSQPSESSSDWSIGNVEDEQECQDVGNHRSVG